jgi:hypothetical protein
MLVVGGAFFVACVGDSSPPAPDASTDATTPDTSTSDAATDVVQDVPVDAAFNPATLGNLQLWVAADVGLALSGGKMTWTDQSPQSHLVQSPNDSSPCSNPTIQTAAINGLSAASFDGHTNCFTVSSGFNDFTNGVSIFVVAQPQNHNSPFLGAESAFVDLSGSSAAQSAEVLFGRAYQPTNTSTGDFQLQTNNTSTTTGLIDTGSGDTYLSGVTHLFEVVLPALPEDQSGTGTLYEDGTVTGAATNNPLGPTIAARAYNFIGWNAWEQVNSYPAYSGLIGEILVYSSALTTSQRQSLEAHLKSKWGL